MAGRPPPVKPWERVAAGASSSGPSPFAPSSGASTSEVVAAAGTAGDDMQQPGREDSSDTVLGRPMPSRPWEALSTSGYGAASPYNRSGMGLGTASGYSSLASGYGSRYGGGMYGGGGYGGAYGSSMYGSGMYGASRYGLGGYGTGMGNYGGYGGGYSGYGSYGGYGGMGYGGGYSGGPGMMMGLPGGDPNDPHMHPEAAPPRAPTFWVSFLRVVHGVMTAFGRLSILVDENTHALHFFITALLQLFDRAGVLYGELARFVLRLLGFRSRPAPPSKKKQLAGSRVGKAPAPMELAVVQGGDAAARSVPSRGAAADTGAWDNLWAGPQH